MRKIINVGFVSVVAVSFAVAIGCGSAASPSDTQKGPTTKGTNDKDPPPPPTGTVPDGQNPPPVPQFKGWMSFHPAGAEKTYNSGFDGTNDYVVPMAFFADGQPTVTFSDPDAAEVNGPILTVDKKLLSDLPDELDGKIQIVFIKTKKAGKTTVTAKSGATTDTATLVITQYSPQDVTVGEQRYDHGMPSCTSCHAAKAVHNPALLADLSDDTVLSIAVEGKPVQQLNADTGKLETVMPNGGDHKWNVTDAERKGLMAYLRSRPFDFQLPTSGAKK